MILQLGCQVQWRIFLLKSRLSGEISSFRFLPDVTFFERRMERGLQESTLASYVDSTLVFRLKVRKKLLYEPVIICLQVAWVKLLVHPLI